MLSEKLDAASFGAALQMHIDRIGLTQGDAAPLLDVSARKLWQMLHGERDTPFPFQLGALEILGRQKAKTPPAPTRPRR